MDQGYTFVKMTLDMGRGLFSSQRILKDTIVCECEILLLSQHDTQVVNKLTELKYYTFKYSDDQDCLVLGNGEIFNHNDTPNVSYELINTGERQLMRFTALVDIPSNTQLFI